MAKDDVLYEVKGHLAIITMNRPDRMNAIDTEMRQELQKAWKQFKYSNDQWVAIFTGAGKAFSVGQDLKERARDRASGMSGEEIYRIQQEVGAYNPRDLEIFKPTIAAVNGYAVAGGFRLAESCDLCVASDQAQFGITEPKWNLGGGWAADLTRHVNLRHVIEMTIVPVRIKAQRAYEMGLVNWVVPQEKLMDKALEVANLILENAPASVAAFIEMYYRPYGLSHNDAMAMGAHIHKHLRSMQDSIEGPKAFAEKRKPVFQNK